MSEKKKNTPKFTFNSFWLYIPILVILLGISYFNSGDLGSRNISKNEFTKILKANDIEKIVVENNNVAQIFLKPEAEKKEDHKKLTDSPFYRKGAPLYSYNFGDLQNFENEIDKAKKENNLDFDKANIERTSMFDTIISFLPFILLIAIWLFFMRRMSGGAGGGAGWWSNFQYWKI